MRACTVKLFSGVILLSVGFGLVPSEGAPSVGSARASDLATTSIAQVTIVHVEPPTSTVTPGETFTVSMAISNVENLGAFQFSLGYTPTVIRAVDAALGPFPGSTGRNVGQVGPTIDNEAGLITFGAFSFGTQPGPEGGGALAELTLTAQGVGETALRLTDTKILHPDGTVVPATVVGGTAVVEGPLVWIEVSPSPVTLLPGQTQQFAATCYDGLDDRVPCTPSWRVALPAAGTIDAATGLFAAGTTPGMYPKAVVASVGSLTATADVTVVEGAYRLWLPVAVHSHGD